ncbi:MAG TPA: DUF6443 domain-containing protein [Cyclobacteriaceae bacterium]|nr:DUF6443 domain-containing protein [Cyclobacteriaceae bacterium]
MKNTLLQQLVCFFFFTGFVCTNAIAQIGVINGPTSVTYGAQSTYSFQNDYDLFNPQWIVSNGTVLWTNNNPSADYFEVTVYWNTSGTGSVSLNDGYPLDTKSVTITPYAPTVNNSTQCGSGTASLSATVGPDADVVRWYSAASGGSPLTTGSTYSPSVSATTTYYVTSYKTSGNIESTPRTAITATVNPTPSTPSPTGAGRCNTGTVTLTASVGANGNVVRWYSVSSGGSPFTTGTSYTTPSLSSSTTYYVSSYNSTTGCESARVGVTATINPIPSLPSPVPGYSCGPGTVLLQATVGANGNQVKWYVNDINNGWTYLASGPSYVTPSLSTTTTYYVSSYNTTTGCESSTTAINANVNPIPNGPTNAYGSSICGTGIAVISGGWGSNANTLRWYDASSGGTLVGTGTSFTTPTISSTTNYYISSYNSTTTCESTSSRLQVVATVNPVPVSPSVTNGNRCGTGAVTLSASPGTNGNTVYWYDASTGGTRVNTGTSYTTPSLSSTTNYYLSSYNTTTSCESTSARVLITATVNPIPAAPTGTGASRCGAGSITLGATIGTNGNTVRWYDAATGGTLLATATSYATPSLSATTTYYISSYNTTTACESTASRVAVIATINPNPVGPIGTGASRCGSGTVTLTGSPGANGNTIRWYDAATNGTLLATSTSYTTLSLSSTTNFYITSYNSTTLCESPSARAQVVATVNSVPSAPSVSGNGRFGIGTLTLTGSGTPSGGSYNWYNPSNTLLSGATTTYTTPSLSASKTNYVYVKSVSSAGCESAATWVNITIVPVPMITGPNRVVMNTVTLDAGSGYDSYTWTNSANQTVGSAQTLSTSIGDTYIVTITKAGIPGNSSSPPYRLYSQLDGQDVNYITTNALLVSGTKNESDIVSLSADNVSQSTQYFDGLDRLVQTVKTQSTPTYKDIVEAVDYDAAGRQAKKYLSYAATSNDGLFKTDALIGTSGYSNSAQYNFYQSTTIKVASDQRPFSETVFEPSPLNRPSKDFGPGKDWYDNNHSVSHTYTTNTDGTSTGQEKIFVWYVNAGLPSRYTALNSGYYPSNSLMVKVTADEQGNQVREYTTIEGKLILKKVQASVGPVDVSNNAQWAQTYYIYDYRGQLRFVLQPELANTLAGSPSDPTSTQLGQFAFQYKYDSRGRMIEKQVPGASVVYLVYDPFDRLVMTQDGNQRNDPNNKEWTFTKYDVLNRAVLTGKVINSLDRATLQTTVNGFYNTPPLGAASYETYQGAAGAVLGYTNKSFPSSITLSDYYTATYYDQYDVFIAPSGYTYVAGDLTGQEASAHPDVLSLTTGTMVKNMGDNSWLRTVRYYDHKARVVQNISQNNKGGLDIVTSVLDFTGKVMKTKTTHKTTIHSDQIIAYRYTYDQTGRKIKTYLSLNNEPNEMLLSQNNYNAVGQLIEKNLHLLYDAQDGLNGTLAADNMVLTQYKGESNVIARNSILLEPNYSFAATGSASYRAGITSVTQAQAETNGRYFQSVDYRYNIRGWLSSMNNSQLSTDATNDDTNDLFGMNLSYNEAVTGLNDNAQLYNGNISAIRWSKNLALGTIKDIAYGYSYDAMNRLSSATYKEHGASWTATDAFDENISQYDLNGNIKHLTRYAASGLIDDLTYDYTNSGNQLLSVSDNSVKTKGFVEPTSTTGNDYGYDANGNMTSDQNKGLTSISYNYMNLPTQVTKSANAKIVYTYDAAGRKLKQELYNSPTNVVKSTVYDGAFIYQGDTLQFINTEEGRIVMSLLSGHNINEARNEYQYHLKDHLGNVRLTFTTGTTTKKFTAGFEATNQTTEQSNFLNYNTSSAYINSTPTNANTGTNSYLLNGGYSGQVGITKTFSVLPGDVVSISAYAKYTTPTGTASNVGTNIVSALTNAFHATASGEIAGLTTYGNWTNGNNIISALGTGDELRSDAIKAFVTIILFDKDYNLLDVTYQAVQSNGIMSASYPVKQAGYAYLYISNEHPYLMNVYFDDVQMSLTPSPVVQQEDFYPFGLSFNKYIRENSVPNTLKLFQNQEHIDDLGLNWDAFKWRNHQPDIGRFFNVDPLAEHFYYNSPYAFSENHVTAHVELEGLEKWYAADGNVMNGPFSQKTIAQYGLRSAQGVGSFVGFTGLRSQSVRMDYRAKTSLLSPNQTAERTQLKAQTRERTPAITREMIEQDRPMSKELTKTGGTANKTNAGYDAKAETAGTIGKAGTLFSAAVSAYNIATAENKTEQTVKESGAWAGAISMGEVGAQLGSVGGVPGSVVTGLVFSVIGAFAGENIMGGSMQSTPVQSNQSPNGQYLAPKDATDRIKINKPN